MSQHKDNASRRSFLKRIVLMAAAVPASRLITGEFKLTGAHAAGLPATPAGKTAISETDAVAQALGYKHNVKDLDYKRYPQRKKPEMKNAFCDNCALYTVEDKNWGKCQMLQAGLVSSKGWCGSWSKKA